MESCAVHPSEPEVRPDSLSELACRVSEQTRAPKGHINTSILENLISDSPLVLGIAYLRLCGLSLQNKSHVSRGVKLCYFAAYVIMSLMLYDVILSQSVLHNKHFAL